MKKLALLLSLALLAACGGSGTNSNSANVVSQPDGQLQMATLNVKVNEPTPKTLALNSNADTVSPTNRLRIVISNPTLRINGVPYKNISTYPVPLPAINYSLPVADGYKIEAFSYRKSSSTLISWLKRYGYDIFSMTPTGASVSVSPTPIDAKIAFRSYSSTTGRMTASTNLNKVYYNISTSGKTAPLGSSWNLVTSDASIPLANSYNGTISYAAFIRLNTPESYTGGTIYALGEFYIDSFYLKDGESATSFKYVYPNLTWGDMDVSQKYSPVKTGGGISIGTGW